MTRIVEPSPVAEVENKVQHLERDMERTGRILVDLVNMLRAVQEEVAGKNRRIEELENKILRLEQKIREAEPDLR